MGMPYTKVKPTAPQEMQLNSGLIIRNFNPATGEVADSDILAATTGGIQFSAVPSYVDFGEDIDNCSKNTKEMKEIDDIEAKVTSTSLSITDTLAKFLAGAADIETVESATHEVSKIIPRRVLEANDFGDLWVVGDYGKNKQGYVAIHILNALNTGGFSMQTTDKGKGQFSMDITAHSSIENPEEVPYEIYIGTPIGEDPEPSPEPTPAGPTTYRLVGEDGSQPAFGKVNIIVAESGSDPVTGNTYSMLVYDAEEGTVTEDPIEITDDEIIINEQDENGSLYEFTVTGNSTSFSMTGSDGRLLGASDGHVETYDPTSEYPTGYATWNMQAYDTDAYAPYLQVDHVFLGYEYGFYAVEEFIDDIRPVKFYEKVED